MAHKATWNILLNLSKNEKQNCHPEDCTCRIALCLSARYALWIFSIGEDCSYDRFWHSGIWCQFQKQKFRDDFIHRTNLVISTHLQNCPWSAVVEYRGCGRGYLLIGVDILSDHCRSKEKIKSPEGKNCVCILVGFWLKTALLCNFNCTFFSGIYKYRNH